jgi:hypothetical protein
MNAHFRGSIRKSEDFNFRRFPFDVQNLFIIFEMSPSSDLGDNVAIEIYASFQHPRYENSTASAAGSIPYTSIKRPHFHLSGVDRLLEWAVLRVQGRPCRHSAREFELIIVLGREP